jgi:ABC-type branched-subunit amino acid transport system substrate-binding protein
MASSGGRTGSRSLVGAVLAVVLGVASACGSSSKAPSSSPAGSSGSATTVAGATGTPIKLMLIYTANSPAANSPEALAGAKAAAMAINSAGGVKGHQIQIIGCNDQFSANIAAQCAETAVSDHVVASIAAQTIYGTSTDPVFQQAGIAMIGNQPTVPTDLSTPVSYPYAPSSINGYEAIVFKFAQMGFTKIAFGVLNNPAGPENADPAEAATAAAKTPSGQPVKNVGVVSIPITASDFSPEATALHETGAQAVLFVTSPQSLGAVVTASKQLGYNQTFGSSFVAPSQLKAYGSALNGLVVDSYLPAIPGTSQGNAGIDEFQSEMAKAAAAGVPDASGIDNVDVTSLDGWLSVYAVQQIASSITGQSVTAASFLPAVQQAKDLNVKGLIVDWTPSKAGPAPYTRISNSNEYFGTIKNSLAYFPSQTPLNVFSALAGS